MKSDTKNVKLGVCKVFLDGVDLGYTQGGVEVTVSTETHKSQVDQFGKTPISEQIMGRQVMAKVPLAETIVEKMVEIMPGATLVVVGGGKASGTVQLATNPLDSETVIINGVTVTFKTTVVDASTQVEIGATANDTAANLKDFLDKSTTPKLALANYTVATNTVTVTYKWYGTEGNDFTLAAGTSGATVSGANLSGGAEPTSKRVDVTDAVGTDLLTIAKELRLHPQAKADSDQSDDFVIPRAMTPGALQFAYKLEEERIFNVEFSGYPDPDTRRLFYVGK